MNTTDHNQHSHSRCWHIVDEKGQPANETAGVGGLIAASCAMVVFYLSFICW